MPTGKVKFWNFDKGFGFIAPDEGGAAAFVHISALEADMDELQEGERVTFEMGVSAKSGRPAAVNVKVVE